MTLEMTLDHNGKKYQAEIGRITDTHLGYEDHGIFSVNVNFDFGGSGQGTGHYGTSQGFGEKFVKAFLNTVGVEKWESLPNKRVIVLRESAYNLIRGISDLQGNNVVIFSDLAEES